LKKLLVSIVKLVVEVELEGLLDVRLDKKNVPTGVNLVKRVVLTGVNLVKNLVWIDKHTETKRNVQEEKGELVVDKTDALCVELVG
jgi:hypothetical protein